MKAIVQHLRFSFSFLLMPIFLFSLFFLPKIFIFQTKTILLFFILHLLVYPSSNAYNSTQDNDVGSIGMIKNPLKVPSSLHAITHVFDIIAMLLALLISTKTAMLIAIFIIVSRLYSNRNIRLKKIPIIGFLTVFIFQGAFIFYIVQVSLNLFFAFNLSVFMYFPYAFIASLFIGSMYPLSQIYQHQQDKNDGVITISNLLGYQNTFLFSAVLFAAANFLLSYYFITVHQIGNLIIFNVFQIPIMLYFIFWFLKVKNNIAHADFSHTMKMNLIAATCQNFCFLFLLILK